MADIKINIQVIEGQAKAALSGLEKQTKQADQAFKGLNLTIKQVSSATSVFLGNIAAQAFTAAIAGVKQFAGAIFDTAVEVDNIKRKLETLTGSAQLAGKAFETIAKFSDESPFELKEVAEASNKLLALGVAVRDLEPALRTLGDISTASGANLSELALAFGKVEQQGVATGREINAFQNNAIPILDALAEVTGKTNGAVKKLAAEGKIDAETFQKALKALGAEGGFAFEAMQKQSQTLGGRLKTLEDSFENLRINLGQALGPAIKAIVIGFTVLVDNITKFATEAKFAASSADFIVTAFSFLVKGTIVAINTFQALRLVVTEFAVLITGILGVAFAGAVEQIKTFIGVARSAAEALGLPTAALDGFIESLNAVQFAGIDAAKDLQESANSIVGDMTNLSVAGDNFATAMESAFTREKTAAAEAASFVGPLFEQQIAKTRELTEAEKEEQRKRLEDKIKFNDALLLEQQRLDGILLEQVLLADGAISAQDELELLRQADVLAREREQQQVSDSLKLGDKNATALLESKIRADQATRNLAIDKKTFDVQEQRRKTDLDNQQAFFGAAVSLASSSNRTLAAIGKAAAITQIAIKTPSAVAGSYEFGATTLGGGPPLGALFAGIAGAAMAAQAAQIAGVKFASGGIVPGNTFSGDTVQARLNSGEMVLNRGQQTRLFDMANNGGGGEQIIQVNNIIELDGEVVARSVSRQVANGLKLGEVV
jgi:tape measure domain-containing protein